MPEKTMIMKPKKSHEEIPEDESNVEIRYFVNPEDGSENPAS
jgi:hypothetical protein